VGREGEKAGGGGGRPRKKGHGGQRRSATGGQRRWRGWAVGSGRGHLSPLLAAPARSLSLALGEPKLAPTSPGRAKRRARDRDRDREKNGAPVPVFSFLCAGRTGKGGGRGRARLLNDGRGTTAQCFERDTRHFGYDSDPARRPSDQLLSRRPLTTHTHTPTHTRGKKGRTPAPTTFQGASLSLLPPPAAASLKARRSSQIARGARRWCSSLFLVLSRWARVAHSARARERRTASSQLSPASLLLSVCVPARPARNTPFQRQTTGNSGDDDDDAQSPSSL
jgi:hypothetical protein